MGNTLLTYQTQTNPDPLQVSPESGDASLARLTVVGSNNTGRVIKCQSISLSFLEGTNARDFCPDPTGITSTAAAGWSITQNGSLFTATPDTPEAEAIGGAGVFFELSGIKVNQQVGTTDMTIIEVTEAGTATNTFALAKFPPQFTVGEITANPPIINQGSSTTLFWSGTSGATYTLEYEDAGGNIVVIDHPDGEPDQPLPATGSYTIDLEASTTIYLNVTLPVPGQDNLTIQRNAPVTVIVPSVQIISLKASPPTVFGPNNNVQVTLTWHVIAGRQFLLNGNIVTGQSETIPVNQATTFTLEATGHEGPVYQEVDVPIAAVNAILSVTSDGVNVSFNANPGAYEVDCTLTVKDGNTSTTTMNSSRVNIGGDGGNIGMGFGSGGQGQIASATVTLSGFPSGDITLNYP